MECSASIGLHETSAKMNNDTTATHQNQTETHFRRRPRDWEAMSCGFQWISATYVSKTIKVQQSEQGSSPWQQWQEQIAPATKTNGQPTMIVGGRRCSRICEVVAMRSRNWHGQSTLLFCCYTLVGTANRVTDRRCET